MVAPSCGVTAAHLQDIHDHLEDCCVRVAPNIVECCQGVDVDDCLCRKFSEEEVEGWYRRSVAELKKTSEGLILEDGQRCDVSWSYWQCREARDKNRQVLGFPNMILNKW